MKQPYRSIGRHLIKKAPLATAQNLVSFTETELSFYNYFNSKRLRLEQEKIPQHYAEQMINEAFKFQPST